MFVIADNQQRDWQIYKNIINIAHVNKWFWLYKTCQVSTYRNKIFIDKPHGARRVKHFGTHVLL